MEQVQGDAEINEVGSLFSGSHQYSRGNTHRNKSLLSNLINIRKKQSTQAGIECFDDEIGELSENTPSAALRHDLAFPCVDPTPLEIITHPCM